MAKAKIVPSSRRKGHLTVASTYEKGKPGERKTCEPSRWNATELIGFPLSELTSWDSFVRLAYRPTDPSSLGVTRALFGLMMVLDIPEERGMADADVRWGNPDECRFPLFSALRPLPLPWMCLVYVIMWMGAVGIAVGLHYRLSCLAFVVPYWYIFLLDKSSWNNHSYLFGLVASLLACTCANHYWSLDGLMGRVTRNGHVPLWNYAILRFQFFVLYFFAGLKKLDTDWIAGYSMTHLNNHWVFLPFKLLLTEEQVDYWIIHLNGFFLDLTVGFWMFFDKTRPVAFVFCALFHLMNSRLFSIGMFPYVCLVTMPLFCHTDWPRKLWDKVGVHTDPHRTDACVYPTLTTSKHSARSTVCCETTLPTRVQWKHRLVVALLLTHVGVQAFLPYSHFITKGYNNWTNGLYGYSWDMMVHSWHTVLVVIKVVDKTTGMEHFLDPEAWVETDKWEKHGDMMHQYARCLRDNLLRNKTAGHDIAIHFDVWCSLNGRFQQRMFDPRVDVLTADWSPWNKVSWLMPLLTEFSSWRERIVDLEQQVFSWSNRSDVLFVADFPGLYLENYISAGITNVTLTVLSGEVTLELLEPRSNITLTSDSSSPVPTEAFHRVHVTSATPSCYMYAFVNDTDFEEAVRDVGGVNVVEEIMFRGENMLRAIALVRNAVFDVVYGVPMPRRVRVG